MRICRNLSIGNGFFLKVWLSIVGRVLGWGGVMCFFGGVLLVDVLIVFLEGRVYRGFGS